LDFPNLGLIFSEFVSDFDIRILDSFYSLLGAMNFLEVLFSNLKR